MKIVGINIKRFREEKGMTLRQLAAGAGVSASLLSQIETGKASPSLSTLKSIADALQTTISVLMGEAHTKSQSSPVQRAQERTALTRMGKGISMYLLTSPDPNKQMEPLLFKMDKKAESGDHRYKHFGQEFVLVLRGTLEVTLNDTTYVLRKGDSMYFNSHVPHSFKNIHDGETEAIWVDTPPTF